MTFGYLLSDDMQKEIKALTLEIYNKGMQGGSSSSSKGAGSAEKAQSSEATAALNEVSDMFR